MLRRALLALFLIAPSAASQTDIEQGRQFYRGHCAHCHGPDGEGGRGVNLTTGKFRHSSNDEELLRTIRAGLPGTEMPGSRLPAADLQKLVAYLRVLGAAGASEKSDGDAAAGEKIYARAGCPSCHALGHGGGNLGPALDSTGLRRSLKFLRDALVEPSAYIPKEYVGVTVVTKSGESITGLRLNDDDYSVQLRDARDRLLSFEKSEVRSVRRLEESLMPAYTDMKDADRRDLIAYLSSLRRVE